MARKTRRTKTNTWLWYGLYAVAGYYGYNWYLQYRAKQTAMVSVPPGTQQ